jgi:transcriptional regulator with XRE-family HTH domain
VGSDLDNLPLRIKRWRESAGLRTKDLAAIIGVQPSAVSQWENPRNPVLPRRENLERLARAFGQTVVTFLQVLPEPIDED